MIRRGTCSLLQICAYLALLFATIVADQEKCDKTKCRGPLMHYESLKCTPVYEKKDDCCATRYNCDHLYARSKSKCYVNGKTYEIHESLRKEDMNPCDIGCVCELGSHGTASFRCAIVDCPSVFFHEKPGCYRKKSALDCCSGEEVCPENPKDIPTCNVNGTIYKDGKSFKVENEPDLVCVCQPGYEGKNIEPFCTRRRRHSCSLDFYDAHSIFNKCAPVYYSNQSPQIGCSVFTRCQNNNDTVIHKNDSKSTNNNDDEHVCHFGNMTMRRGDELNQATHYSSVCVKCVCEVPPVPTCQRLPDSECDVRNHPPFSSSGPY